MSKKGTYNGPFFNAFASRLHGTPIRFGILIGTEVNEGQRDAVFAAPTPQQMGEDGEPKAPVKDVAELLKSKGGGMTFTDWVASHAAAIQKLLPGGLEPCGCFAVVTESAARDLAPLLAPLLKGYTEPLVLTFDPTSRKMSFWQYSGGAKPALRPATIKADSHKDALLLWCATPVDLVLPLAMSAATESTGDANSADLQADALAEAAQRSVSAMFESFTVGLSAENAPLRVVDLSSDTAVSSLVPKDCSEVRLSFLRGGTSLAKCTETDRLPQMRQSCLVVATALVLRRNVELRNVVGSLRKAIASSAGERVRIGLEEAEGGSMLGKLPLPWRALCKPSDSELPIWCGDYCMPDETSTSALERLGEFLGVPQSEFEEAPAHLSECQRLSEDHKGTYAPPETSQESNGSAQGGGRKAGASAMPAAACAAAVGALVLAILVPTVFKLL